MTELMKDTKEKLIKELVDLFKIGLYGRTIEELKRIKDTISSSLISPNKAPTPAIVILDPSCPKEIILESIRNIADKMEIEWGLSKIDTGRLIRKPQEDEDGN